jgi:hypothetical protein
MLQAISSRASLSSKGLSAWGVRSFTTSCLWFAKQMPPRPPPVNEDDIMEAFLKGSGPGGQKIVGQLLAFSTFTIPYYPSKYVPRAEKLS